MWTQNSYNFGEFGHNYGCKKCDDLGDLLSCRGCLLHIIIESHFCYICCNLDQRSWNSQADTGTRNPVCRVLFSNYLGRGCLAAPRRAATWYKIAVVVVWEVVEESCSASDCSGQDSLGWLYKR